MSSLRDDLLVQVDELLAAAYEVRSMPTRDGEELAHANIASVKVAARARAAIQRIAPPGSTYRENLESFGKASPGLIGRLEALRDDIAGGYLTTIEELVHADVFSDFLEMADELLRARYKDAAAVIAGSVLEEHLRKLAARYGVSIENNQGRRRKADALNADLAKQGAYNKLEQKSVTAWLGLRNDAAHGNYDEYDANQVAALIRDVREFMVRHPA